MLNEGKDRARDNPDRLACREHLLEMIAENFEGVSALKSQGDDIKRGVGVVRD